MPSVVPKTVSLRGLKLAVFFMSSDGFIGKAYNGFIYELDDFLTFWLSYWHEAHGIRKKEMKRKRYLD
jgi:hypothetical protein